MFIFDKLKGEKEKSFSSFLLRKNTEFKDGILRKYSNEKLMKAMERVAKLGYNRSSELIGISKSTLTRYRKEIYK